MQIEKKKTQKIKTHFLDWGQQLEGGMPSALSYYTDDKSKI